MRCGCKRTMLITREGLATEKSGEAFVCVVGEAVPSLRRACVRKGKGF